MLDRQVEQDLVISRALVELLSRAAIANALAFRGGAALYKLHLCPPARYSEDIDLVQTSPGGIGEVLVAIHAALDSWLGEPKWKQTEGRVALSYRFDSEDAPPTPLKLKIEINSREHFSVQRLRDQRFEVSYRWFSGSANLRTYEPTEPGSSPNSSPPTRPSCRPGIRCCRDELAGEHGSVPSDEDDGAGAE